MDDTKSSDSPQKPTDTGDSIMSAVDTSIEKKVEKPPKPSDSSKDKPKSTNLSDKKSDVQKPSDSTDPDEDKPKDANFSDKKQDQESEDEKQTDTDKKVKKVTQSDGSVEGARVEKLQAQIKSASLPPDLKERVDLMIQQASSSIKYGQIASLEQAERYVNLVSDLPWEKRTEDNLELTSVRQIMDKNHYGMNSTKERIIEYLSVLKLQEKQAEEKGTNAVPSRAPIICFVGLVGTGKTTFAISIAEAMSRKFIRIPFGGMGAAADLRGQSRVHPDAEPGHVIKSYLRAESINPVILLDEIDRVTEDARADIMGVLVEMLDPEQNVAFTDHYLDYPFNLSQTIFIATANNTKNIATAVMDRIEPIQMPSYSDDEKVVIGRDYVLPRQLKNCGLTNEQLKIDDALWPKIVRPTGFDAGIRTLERTLNGICRKTARIIVEGKAKNVTITQDNLKKFVQQW